MTDAGGGRSPEEALRAHLDLWRDFERYASHDGNECSRRDKGFRCECGLDDARARWLSGEAGKP